MSDWSDSDDSAWSAEISNVTSSSASKSRNRGSLTMPPGMSSDHEIHTRNEPPIPPPPPGPPRPPPPDFKIHPGSSKSSARLPNPPNISEHASSSSKERFRPLVEAKHGSHAEIPYLSKEETAERMKLWNERSKDGGFDPDTYIVDPIAHYSHLEYTEELVVTSSEYFRCKGEYQCEDNSIPSFSSSGSEKNSWTSNMLPTLQGMTSESLTRSFGVGAQQYEDEKWILDSLWKSYMILCKTIETFNELRMMGFCKTFYSMLVERESTKEAEIVRINSTLLDGLKTGIENAIQAIFRRRDLEGTEYILTSFVATQCDAILQTLGLVPEGGNIPICAMCRVVVLLLDLAIVSYAGSHGSRFTSYVNSGAETIEIQSKNNDIPNFRCTLRNLSCLSNFLDNCKVWVFHKKVHHSIHSRKRPGALSILTRMEEFSDIWGPVWTIPVGPEHPDKVLQYNLSRGFIRPVPGGATKPAVECHWYSNIDDAPRTEDNLLMGSNDLLSIGTGLVANSQCLYTLDHYQVDFGTSMGFLGTVSEAWALDARTLALGVGQYLVLTASGTQKKIPAVTLKEHTWNKLKHDPQSANIQFLNNFTGVEISHCTGNARRVHLKELFRLKRVRERLTQYYHDWELTEWGVFFSEALENQDFESISTLWVHRRDLRPDMGRFIAQMLELLHVTGLKGNSIIAGYFVDQQDRCLEINIKGNEWGKCLRDSILMASYVVIGDNCLKYPRRNPITAACSHRLNKTMLATQIMFRNELPSETDYIRLEPAGDLFQPSEIQRGRIILVPTDGQIALRMLHPITKVANEMWPKLGPENPKTNSLP